MEILIKFSGKTLSYSLDGGLGKFMVEKSVKRPDEYFVLYNVCGIKQYIVNKMKKNTFNQCLAIPTIYDVVNHNWRRHENFYVMLETDI